MIRVEYSEVNLGKTVGEGEGTGRRKVIVAVVHRAGVEPQHGRGKGRHVRGTGRGTGRGRGTGKGRERPGHVLGGSHRGETKERRRVDRSAQVCSGCTVAFRARVGIRVRVQP